MKPQKSSCLCLLMPSLFLYLCECECWRVWVWQGSRVHGYGGQRQLQVSPFRHLFIFVWDGVSHWVRQGHHTSQASWPTGFQRSSCLYPNVAFTGIIGVHDHNSISHRNRSGSYMWEASSSPGGISQALFWSFLLIANIMCVGARVLQAHE